MKISLLLPIRRRWLALFRQGLSALEPLIRHLIVAWRPIESRLARVMRPVTRRLPRVLRTTRGTLALGAGVLVLAVLPVVIWQLRAPSSGVEAAWFDQSYGFRKRIPVTNGSGSTQTDFQLQATIDTAALITAGKMQADCDDIRFTSINGKVLDYWLEPTTCNTATTLVWFKADSIPTTGAQVYFYYGNPSAATASDTASTFIQDITGVAAAWPLDDTTTTQSYSRVTNPFEDVGRNVVINPGFDTDTIWSKGTGWTIANGVAHQDGTGDGTTAGDLVQSSLVVTGKVYSITYTISNYVSGSTYAMVGITLGTARSANGTYTQTLVAGSTTSRTGIKIASTPFVGDIDNISITQLNIPSSPDTPATQLLTDGDMEDADGSPTSSWTANAATLSKQTGTPHGGSQVLRVAPTASNSYALQNFGGVAGQAYRVTGYFRGNGTDAPRIAQGGSIVVSGTSSTAWQPFDAVYVAINSLGIYLVDATATVGQYVEFDDVTVSLDTSIRQGEVIVDGDMEYADTSAWGSLNGTLSKETNSPHAGSQVMRLTNTVSAPRFWPSRLLAGGKTYRVSGYMRGDGVNSTNLVVRNYATGGSQYTVLISYSSTNWAYFEATLWLPNSNSWDIIASNLTAGYVDFDDISVTEVSPLVGISTNGVVLGSSSGAGGHLTNAYTFDGINDNVNIYSSDLNSVFNPDEGTLVAWAKVSGSGVWSDTTTRRILFLGKDTSTNFVNMYSSGSSTLNVQYMAGSISKGTNVSSGSFSSTNWFQVVITWSKSNDEVKLYLNGAQGGSTQTGLGTWSGNLASVDTVIGALNTSGTQPWSGMINDVRLYSRALSADEISNQYSASSDIQAYITGNFQGHELLRKYNTSVTLGAFASEEVGPGPILSWGLDDAQGQYAQDGTSSNNDGTLGANATPASDDPTWITEERCISSKCLQFDGTDDIVTGSAVAHGIQTVSFWLNLTNTAATTQGIFNLDGGTHKISVDGSGMLSASGFTSPTYYINGKVLATPQLSTNQWNFVEITTATGFDSTSSFTLGSDGASFATGVVDEVKFYSYARSSAQVKVDFNNGAVSLGKSGQIVGYPAGLVAAWPLDETTTTQSYSRVVSPYEDVGRNIVVNGTFDSDTLWTKGGGWTIASGVATNSGTGNTLNPVTSILTLGKVYTVTYSITSYTSGSVRVKMGSSTTGTSRSAVGTYTETLVCTGNTTLAFDSATTFTGSIDNVIVQQVNIPATPNVAATQLLADGDMEAGDTSAWTEKSAATLTKETTNPHGGTRLFRVTSNGNSSARAAQLGVMQTGQVYRIYGYAKSDGTRIPTLDVGDSLGNIISSTLFTGTTSTAWQSFDVVFVAAGPSILLKTPSISGYTEWDDITVSLDTGIRQGEILQDGDMEKAGVTDWTVYDNATLTKEVTSPHGGSQAIRVMRSTQSNASARQTILTLGKTYRATAWCRSDGTGTPVLVVQTSSNPSCTTSTSWQFLDFTFVAAQTTVDLRTLNGSSGNHTEWDDVSVTEVSPLVGKPTNGVVLGSASGGHLTNAYTFDGINDNVNIYSSDLNSAFNPSEGTIVAWAKVSAAGVWTDNTQRQVTRVLADGSNYFEIYKSVGNSLVFATQSGGTSKTVSLSAAGAGSTTSWMQLVFTWSKSDNQLKAYFNGSQTGSTQTGLGTWTGNLSATSVAIGATGSGGGNSWSGMINDVQLYNRALSPDQIQSMYNSSALGPVGYWKMDEGSGSSVTDNSGSGYNSSSITGTSWTNGKYGGALEFDGDGDQIDLGNVLDIGTQNFTAMGWFRRDSDTTHDFIFGNLPGTAGWRIYVTANDQVSATFDDGPDDIGLLSSNVYTASTTWHHFAAVLDRSGNDKTVLYVDGVKVDDATDDGTLISDLGDMTNATNLLLGASGGASDSSFDGALDELKIYNYARTSSQIIEDMNAGHPLGGSPVGSPLVYWAMDEQNGTGANSVHNTGSGGSTYNANNTGGAWKTRTDCKTNGCLEVDTSTDTVSAGDVAFVDSLTQMSVSMWINPASLATNASILGKWNSLAETNFLIRTAGSSDEVYFFVANTTTDGGTSYLLTTNLDLAATTWTHLTFIYDGSQAAANRAKIFKNGLQVSGTIGGTLPTSMTTGTTSSLILGDSPAITNTLLAKYDEVKIYTTALTAEQVKLDMNSGASINYGSTSSSENTLLADGAGNPPVAYWPMDEKQDNTCTSGVNDVCDKSGNGYDGAITGATWGKGKIGGAVSFNGGDYVSGFSISTLTQFTAEAWVKVDETYIPSDNIMNIFGGVSAFTYMGLYNTGVNDGKVSWYDGNGWRYSSSRIDDNQWHHVIYQFDNGAHYIWVDGVKEYNNASGNGTYVNGTSNIIGAYSTGSRGRDFSGLIDDIKIYNYLRTQSQIAYDYDRGLPVGYWQLDECQGTTAYDASGNSLNGTITIGASGEDTVGDCTTASTAWGDGASGKYNSSLNFDAADDKITITDNSILDLTEAVTVSAWVNPSALGALFRRVVAKMGSGEATGYMLDVVSVTNYPRFRINGTDCISTKALTTSQWYHLMGTYDKTNIKIYVNGQLTNTCAYSTAIAANSENLVIGDRSDGNSPFAGKIDDIRVYNYALSADQVKQVYNQGSGARFGPSSGSP